jgi:hypothetical protein
MTTERFDPHANGDDDGLFSDEPWEVEISELLGRLHVVEPPPGFIEHAVDHRPLFAGRSIAAMVTATAMLLAASIAAGAFGQPRLVPDLSTLTAGGAVVHNGSSASVFRQAGIVELDDLPGGQRFELDGRDAWVHADEGVVVVSTGASVVTMVGVTPDEAGALLDEVDRGPEGLSGVINRLTADLGFPDLS